MWLGRLALLGTATMVLAVAVSNTARGADTYPYPYELYKQDPKFREAIRSALGPKPHPWLAQLRGVQVPVAYMSIGPDREEHLAIRICRPHNCGTEYAFILYSPRRNLAYGKVNGEETYLGRPPKHVKAALDAEFDPLGTERAAREAYDREAW
jgi:inhibitor of lysozyme (Ivy)